MEEETLNSEESADSSMSEAINTTQPDYIAKQYRRIRTRDGWASRGERIGVAWQQANGSLCIRLNGAQVISNDFYLFQAESQSPE